ncbi:MAG TPA: hypothetical protein VKG02_02185 [Blastocatellia bacterium]|nr:hypothetical protein [Blastocatellia bacterium]
MKKQILSIVVTLSVIAAMSIAGFAGLSGTLKANIPFDFMTGGKKFPAGEYVVRTGTSQSTLEVRNLKTNQAVIAISRGLEVRAGGKPQLVFHRYGDQYFLAKATDYWSGIELPMSKAEREAAKAKRDLLTMKDAGPEIVTVNAQIGQ